MENAYSASLFQLLNIYLNGESITFIYNIYTLSYLHLLIAVKGNSQIALTLIFDFKAQTTLSLALVFPRFSASQVNFLQVLIDSSLLMIRYAGHYNCLRFDLKTGKM